MHVLFGVISTAFIKQFSLLSCHSFKVAFVHHHRLMATQMTVLEQSQLISSCHITVTLDIQFLVQILQGFVRVMENGLGLHPSVRKVIHACMAIIVLE